LTLAEIRSELRTFRKTRLAKAGGWQTFAQTLTSRREAVRLFRA